MITAWDFELLLYTLYTISMFPFGSYGVFEGWKESKRKYRFPVTPPLYSLCALGCKWFGLQLGVVIYLIKHTGSVQVTCFCKNFHEIKVLLSVVYGSFKYFHVKNYVIVENCVN